MAGCVLVFGLMMVKTSILMLAADVRCKARSQHRIQVANHPGNTVRMYGIISYHLLYGHGAYKSLHSYDGLRYVLARTTYYVLTGTLLSPPGRTYSLFWTTTSTYTTIYRDTGSELLSAAFSKSIRNRGRHLHPMNARARRPDDRSPNLQQQRIKKMGMPTAWIRKFSMIDRHHHTKIWNVDNHLLKLLQASPGVDI